jgi:FixJ family two-component response regulator
MFAPSRVWRYHIFPLDTYPRRFRHNTRGTNNVIMTKTALDNGAPTDPARGAIIAVVDDDRRILGSLEVLLLSADHEVRLFDSAEALVASGELSRIDCLISDVAMPVMDGFELMRVAHQARPELPVILVSGRYDVVDRLPTAGAVAYRFLRKPFDGEALLAAVADALRSAPRHRSRTS